MLDNTTFEKPWACRFSNEISFEVYDTLFPNALRIMAEITLQLRLAALGTLSYNGKDYFEVLTCLKKYCSIENLF